MSKPDWLRQAEEKGLRIRTTTVNAEAVPAGTGVAVTPDAVTYIVPDPAVMAAMTEAAFEALVEAYAKDNGWRVYHTHDSRGSDPGYPDLTLCRPPHVVFAELKTKTGRLRSSQVAWNLDLAACPGVRAFVWRPTDWPQVEAVLKYVPPAPRSPEVTVHDDAQLDAAVQGVPRAPDGEPGSDLHGVPGHHGPGEEGADGGPAADPA